MSIKINRISLSNAVQVIRSKLSTKIILSILLLLFFTCGAFGFSSYMINARLVDKLLQQFDLRLASDISTLTESLNGEVPGYEEITGTDHAAYTAIKEKLELLKTNLTLENVYILEKNNDDGHIVILTGEPADFGIAYPFTEEMNQAVDENQVVVSPIYEDEYGIHKSVFAPLATKSGEIRALAGIDLDASIVPATSREINTMTFIITIIVLVVGISLAFLISRMVTSPIHRLAIATKRVAEGDLTAEVELKRKDEIGNLAQSFKEMNDNLKTLIRHIFTSAEKISATSSQLFSSSTESSRGAEQVAGSMNSMNDGINHVVGSITESAETIVSMNKELLQVTEEASEMNQIAQNMVDRSLEGREMVEKAMEQMNEIKDIIIHSSHVTQQLSNRSNDIVEIIDLISGIADQTNLLALNASIEAARVGEQGRGFGVVAGEIRKLAEQSRQSAITISELVLGTQRDSQQVVEMIGKGHEVVTQGHQLISSTNEGYQEIVSGISFVEQRIKHLIGVIQQVKDSFNTISGSMQQISGVSQEQASGIEEIAAVTEQQSASLQQINASVEILSSMSNELQNAVKTFKLNR